MTALTSTLASDGQSALARRVIAMEASPDVRRPGVFLGRAGRGRGSVPPENVARLHLQGKTVSNCGMAHRSQLWDFVSNLELETKRLEKEGFVILDRVLDPSEISEVTKALAPYERERPMGRNGFEGEHTQRVYSLAAKGAVFMRIAEHPRIVALLDRLLLPNWLLSTFQSIRLHPGETPQPWHCDDAFYPVPRPRTKLAISTIWAMEDFTGENGATQVIPGSHLWGNDHPDERRHRVVPAIMPAGSVMVFDGALWHRGGANQTCRTRLALSPQYCQPWLRQQESQLLIVPPGPAGRCTPRGRSMLGYSIHPPFIGQVDGMNPLRLVDPQYRSGNRTRLTKEAKLADEFLKRPVS
jgi:hypothetical protein